MVKIRLRRMGSTHRPFYRVVVSDSRNVPTSRAIEEIGFYNPIVEPKVVEIDRERFDYWVSNGAQVTPTVRKLVEKGAAAPAAAAPAAPAAATAPEAKPEAAPEATPEVTAETAEAPAEAQA